MNCPNCGKELHECGVILPNEPNDRWRNAWVCVCAPKKSLPTHVTKGYSVKSEKPFHNAQPVQDIGVVIGGPDDPQRNERVEGTKGAFG